MNVFKLTTFFLLILLLVVACQQQPKQTGSSSITTSTTADTKPPSKNNWICVPGKSVGNIRPNTTEKELVAMFGEKRVTLDSVLRKSSYWYFTKVLPGTPNELEIIWHPNQVFKQIQRIHVKHPAAKWVTNSGIKMGTTLQEVVKLNKIDFNLYGFSSNLGGSVYSWEGGEMPQALGLKFDYQADLSAVKPEELETIVNVEEVNTSNPVLQKMEVKVKELYFYFE